MKKIILALITSSVLALASEVTIDATMKLMQQGMNQIHTGFMMHSKKDIEQGIATVESSNSIFTHVDVASFIKSNKVTVARNINKNLEKDLKTLKKSIADAQYTKATADYAKVLNDCMACHTIIRGW